MKKKELTRFGGGCDGESVSVKKVKNREFHVAGWMLQEDIGVFNKLQSYNEEVDLISPITGRGGMECFVKQAEIGNEQGWDPLKEQRIYKYTVDLVSTGRDEGGNNRNAIVTKLIGDGAGSDSSGGS